MPGINGEKNTSNLRKNRGLFIVLEGLDGAGKTSVARRLVDDLSRLGFEAVYTYEPYDTLYVKALKNYGEYRDAALDALTYAADRLVHYRMVIGPMLSRGGFVVSDRYYYSSVAYQAAGGVDPEWVLDINRYAPNPDIAIYLDIDPETGLKRRSGLSTRFPEYEKLEYLERVRWFYKWLVERGFLLLVDASRSFEDVYRDVWGIVSGRITG